MYCVHEYVRTFEFRVRARILCLAPALLLATTMSLLSWLATAKQPAPVSGEDSLPSLSVDEEELPSNVEPGEQCMQPPNVTGTAHLIPERAHQPILPFPLRSFGKQQRAFCASWYKKYPWLHYQEANDSVLCFYCLVAEKRGLGSSVVVRNKSAEDVFVTTGFSNWKKALERFEKHQSSLSHRDAMD